MHAQVFYQCTDLIREAIFSSEVTLREIAEKDCSILDECKEEKKKTGVQNMS